jgi:MFS family permease
VVDTSRAHGPEAGGVESGYAWARLVVSLVICTVGNVALWSVVVVLPTVQADFGVARGDASLPYTAAMMGAVVGGVIMGWLADRFGIVLPVMLGGASLALGYVLAGLSQNIWQFTLAHALLIGLLGGAAMFAPVIADVSHWFTRNRGLAIAVGATGSYLAGTIWPPIVQHLIDHVGWRQTHMIIGATAAVVILPLSLMLRRRAPHLARAGRASRAASTPASLGGLKPATLQILLMVAGIGCCVAMAMPQVHIVAYCGDLGYGAAHGAEMLSVMLGFGIISRLGSGWIADRIGPLQTLLLSSLLQALSLTLFLPFDGLASLYVISALFGLVQGGLVPSYALIVRQYFAPAEAGTRVGLVLSATMAGMALGGWMSGALYDWTHSYEAAFLNGIAWNIAHLAVATWLLWRLGGVARPRVA